MNKTINACIAPSRIKNRSLNYLTLENQHHEPAKGLKPASDKELHTKGKELRKSGGNKREIASIKKTPALKNRAGVIRERSFLLQKLCGFIVMDSFENLEIQHDKAPELVDSAAHQEFIKRCRPHGLSHFVIY